MVPLTWSLGEDSTCRFVGFMSRVLGTLISRNNHSCHIVALLGNKQRV